MESIYDINNAPPTFSRNALHSHEFSVSLVGTGCRPDQLFEFLSENPTDFGFHSMDSVNVKPMLFYLPDAHKTTMGGSYLVIVSKAPSPPGLVQNSEVFSLRFFLIYITSPTARNMSFLQPRSSQLEHICRSVKQWLAQVTQNVIQTDRSIRLWNQLCDFSVPLSFLALFELPDLLEH